MNPTFHTSLLTPHPGWAVPQTDPHRQSPQSPSPPPSAFLTSAESTLHAHPPTLARGDRGVTLPLLLPWIPPTHKVDSSTSKTDCTSPPCLYLRSPAPAQAATVHGRTRNSFSAPPPGPHEPQPRSRLECCTDFPLSLEQTHALHPHSAENILTTPLRALLGFSPETLPPPRGHP